MTRTGGELVGLLRSLGVSDDDLERAAARDLIPLLAVETFVLDDMRHDIDDVARLTGMELERIRQIWGALGFAAPRPGEAVFTDTDVEHIRAVADLVDSGSADPDVLIQLTRVIGSSMARIANAQVEVLATRDQSKELVVSDGATWFGDTFVAILEQVWRRHLQSAARGRLSSPSGPDAPVQAVGFADLVGFTALSQQLDTRALAAVVDRFETVAYAIVGGHGGRVVKMIGDEVMFAVDDPDEAVRCAVDLAESYHEADDLSDVRVGVAYGTVVDRDGDLYGPPVNLASRITSIAYPGSVVIDDEVRQRVTVSDEFEIRSMLPRRLKHIGRVQLHVVRSIDGGDEERSATRRARRRARVAELIRDVTPLVRSTDAEV